MGQQLSVSVVIACYTEDRWPFIVRAVESARSQDPPPERVVVAVDYNADLSARLRRELDDLLIVDNDLGRGASGARNSAVARVTTPFVAFLDDDAAARPGWLKCLLDPFSDPQIIGTGGQIVPEWELPAPRWFPQEFAWVVGGSYAGLPTSTQRVRNVWSGNMAVRRRVFEQVGGFRHGFGKVGSAARPEDTDLCIRMGKAVEGGTWMYVPDAKVDHWVPAERGRLRFFLRRCRDEGRGKVELAGLLGGPGDLGNERDYVRSVIPSAIRREVMASFAKRDVAPLLLAGSMTLGLAAAATGAAGQMLARVAARSVSR